MKNTMTKFFLHAALAAFAATAALAAPIPVTINTGGLAGAGTIDIQFNPGSFPAVYNAGTATITSFVVSGGTLGSVAFGPDGGAVGGGALPGPLAIVNSDFLNGIGYNATFGSQISFLLDLTGAAFTGGGQSILTTFSITLTDGNSTISGIADLIGNSALDTTQSSPEVTFGQTSNVPEPSAIDMVSAGIGVLLLMAARARRKSKIQSN
jgi:hypothetical protein